MCPRESGAPRLACAAKPERGWPSRSRFKWDHVIRIFQTAGHIGACRGWPSRAPAVVTCASSGRLFPVLCLVVLCLNHLFAAPCSPPASGIVGWWPGDGNANDLIGTNTGSLLGGATASAAGVV